MLDKDKGIDLDTVADELYGLAPSEFTPQRDARATAARRGGDRALAAEIKKLRRPTTAAWLANLLTRERGQQITDLLDLGAALRTAQAKLATEDLRRLSLERHRELAGLEGEARELADRYGQAVSDAAAHELAATLEAALADEEAADALRAGRLTTGLHYSGLGLVGAEYDATHDLASHDGIGGADEPLPKPVEADKKPLRPDQPRAWGESRPRLSRETKAALDKAEAALGRAEREAKEKRARLNLARAERDRRAGEIVDLEHRLQALRDAEEQAGGEVEGAEQAVDAAERAVLAAQDELAQARAIAGTRP
jgi:hypothetical protein